MTLEDEHGVVHMLVVGAVENAELLLAMRGIVGGVDIQQNLAALADLLSAEANELIEQGLVQAHQIAGRRGILPATERGLGAERFSQLLIGNDLEGGNVLTRGAARRPVPAACDERLGGSAFSPARRKSPPSNSSLARELAEIRAILVPLPEK
jgi:hypothetical protein